MSKLHDINLDDDTPIRVYNLLFGDDSGLTIMDIYSAFMLEQNIFALRLHPEITKLLEGSKKERTITIDLIATALKVRLYNE